jgi:pSer/pThr/pTyr-binding forkhead associated (FHA) protein
MTLTYRIFLHQVYIRDLDSPFGTFVNGVKITTDTLLQQGDVFVCLNRAVLQFPGTYLLSFRVLEVLSNVIAKLLPISPTTTLNPSLQK